MNDFENTVNSEIQENSENKKKKKEKSIDDKILEAQENLNRLRKEKEEKRKRNAIKFFKECKIAEFLDDNKKLAELKIKVKEAVKNLK